MQKISRFAVPTIGGSLLALAGQLAGLACSTSGSLADSPAGAESEIDAGDASPAPGSPDGSPDVTDAAICPNLAAIDLAAANVASEPDDGRHTGVVATEQKRDENGAYRAGFNATFRLRAEDAGDAGIPFCTTTTIANCTLRSCENEDAGVAPDPTYPTAGEIYLTASGVPEAGANVRCGSLFIPPVIDGGLGVQGYLGAGVSQKLYEPGEVVTLRASGEANAVPPFTVSFTAAAQIETTSPLLGGYDDPTVFSKATGGSIAWTPAGPGMVEVELSGSGLGLLRVLTCRGEGTLGTMTVPKEALAYFETAPEGGRSGGIYVRAQTTKQIVAGKYRIDFTAKTPELIGWYRLAE